jgi:cellulose synthase (UDP-forming)
MEQATGKPEAVREPPLFSQTERLFLLAGLGFLVLCLFFFFGLNVWRTLVDSRSLGEGLFLGWLLLCQVFLSAHGLAYFGGILRVVAAEHSGKKAEVASPELAPLDHYPPVMIAVCAYKEPLDVVEETMICFRNLTYPEKHLFLLDDTRYDQGDPEEMQAYRLEIEEICRRVGVNLFRREWHGAKAGMINDFLDFLHGRIRPDFEFSNYQGEPVAASPVYLAVFDADMNPLPDFVEPLVAMLESDPQLAFVQTPQYYSNVFSNRMAYGSSMQQTIFYEYICDGKSLQRLMPCCGTNVMFRIAALESVGGMDDSSITEDFATSLKMHMIGWRSIYMNHICAFGMGPQDLAGYFKQQFRWALGSVGLLRVVLGNLLRSPRSLPVQGWCEYIASVSYYCVGWVWVSMWIAPVVGIFFHFPGATATPLFTAALFVPYFVASMFLFIYSLTRRRYRIGDVMTSVALNALCFPVFMKASLLGLLGVKGSFGITPKKGATELPLWNLWPQLLVIVISVAAIFWGAMDVYYNRTAPGTYLVNAMWCLYNLGMVSMVLYFNHPERPIRMFGSKQHPA